MAEDEQPRGRDRAPGEAQAGPGGAGDRTGWEERRRGWIRSLVAIAERAEARRDEEERARERPPLLGNYAYVCTRCRARRAKLVGPDTVERLMRMRLSEIARFMEESAYREEVDRLAQRFSGVDLIEHALNENLAATYREVLSWCRGKPRYFLEAYLKRWDAWNLKTILRSTFSGADPDEVRHELVPAGALGMEDLAPLLEEGTVLDAVAALSGTEWHPPLARVLEETDQTEAVEGLTEIENALDRHVYEGLVARIPKRGRANKRFARFIREEIDLVNLRTILRLNRDGYGPEDIRPLILDGGEEVVGEALSALMAETDLTGTAQVMRDHGLAEGIEATVDQMVEDNDVSEVIGQLERLHIRSAGRGKNLYPLSMLPILDFVMAKKAEVDTIRIIARGKEHQLDPEAIEAQVVVT